MLIFVWHSLWKTFLMASEMNLHIMTSADFWKTDCISVNIDQFSSKLWYVLAETILHRCNLHHGVFLRLKEACQFYSFCVYSLRDMIYFSKLDSTFPSYTSNISVVLASFSLSFEYVVAEPISYHKYAIYFFDQIPGSCSNFTCKVGFENSFFRLHVIAMGNVLVYR